MPKSPEVEAKTRKIPVKAH
ncbi:MAG: hypothetical protein OEM91_04455 [Hyphomicrobiales bacterium]|nr:hypothetical protein [Hyphomicrobiales bacterium]